MLIVARPRDSPCARSLSRVCVRPESATPACCSGSRGSVAAHFGPASPVGLVLFQVSDSDMGWTALVPVLLSVFSVGLAAGAPDGPDVQGRVG